MIIFGGVDEASESRLTDSKTLGAHFSFNELSKTVSPVGSLAQKDGPQARNEHIAVAVRKNASLAVSPRMTRISANTVTSGSSRAHRNRGPSS